MYNNFLKVTVLVVCMGYTYPAGLFKYTLIRPAPLLTCHVTSRLPVVSVPLSCTFSRPVHSSKSDELKKNIIFAEKKAQSALARCCSYAANASSDCPGEIIQRNNEVLSALAFSDYRFWSNKAASLKQELEKSKQ